MRLLRITLFSLLIFAAAMATAQSQHGIQFTWTESTVTTPPLTFNLYCGTATGVYPSSPTVSGIPATLSGTLEGPYLWTTGLPGTTYYCVVTAVSALGLESGHSNEASATFPAPPPSPAGLAAAPK